MAIALDVGNTSSSAEFRFRELDDVFLQNQTRIWIGEVLQTRLDEKKNVSELLADGELLFQVSEVLRKLMLSSCIEINHSKEDKTAALRNISGKYKPYSNVDSFLKICKFLGLDSIDLFSPPDVVEKKNCRRVCMCMRSLSKKARSKKLNVPDFDIVTYTISMSKCIVGCLRRSLEQSQCSDRDSFGKLKLNFPEDACDTNTNCSSCASPNFNFPSNDSAASITFDSEYSATSTKVEEQSDDRESEIDDSIWNHDLGNEVYLEEDDDIVVYSDSEAGFGRRYCDEIEDPGVSSSPGSACSVSNNAMRSDFEDENNLENCRIKSQFPIPDSKSDKDKRKVEGDVGLSRTLLGVAMSSIVAFGLFILFDHFRKNQIRGAVKGTAISSSFSRKRDNEGKENKVYSAEKLRLG